MTTYRLYFMDPFTGSIKRYDDFDAVSDSDAGDYAECRVGEERLELWCGSERIGQYPAVEKGPSRSRTLSAVKLELVPASAITPSQVSNEGRLQTP